MKRDGTHQHKCVLHASGCKELIECSDRNLERNHDPDGVICSVNPRDEIECELCDSSRCTDCGHVMALEKAHAEDCPKATAV